MHDDFAILETVGLTLAERKRLAAATDFIGWGLLRHQQTSEQLPPHLADRLHVSDGEATWNGRHGRRAGVEEDSHRCPLSTEKVIGLGGWYNMRPVRNVIA